MKVTVDDDRCRGHGVCGTICPEVFTLTDEGYTVVQTPEIPAESKEAVRTASGSCPERAITVS